MSRNLVYVFAGLFACATAAFGADLPDRDRDGIEDRKDLCPRTPPTLTALVRGCSELDLAARPSLLFGPTLKAVEHAVAGGGRFAEDSDTQRRLQPLRETVEKASRSFASGRFCESASHFRAVESQIRHVAAETTRRWRLKQAVGGRSDGDVSAADSRAVYLRMIGSLFDDAVAEATAAARLIAGRCRTARPFSLRARVVRIDDHDRRIVLEGARTFVLAPDVRAPFLTEGIMVDVTGNGSVLTGALAGESVVQVPTGLQCTHLRIAPAQDFLLASSYTLHPIKAYRSNGILHLERGARLAVEDSCLPATTPAPGAAFTRRSMKLVLNYLCGLEAAETVLASDLAHGDTPVPFPPCIWGVPIATLTVTRQVESCTILPNGEPDCSDPSSGSSETHKLAVMASYSYCQATYDTVLFDLPDWDMTSFRTSQVSAVTTGLLFFDDPGAQRKFSAEGYSVKNGVSSYPSSQTIGVGDRFAVYNHDFYDPDVLWSEESNGVDHPAGLYWPRLRSTRNGEEFWYSCQMPRLTRDVVDFCASSQPHSFYKMPFWVGLPKWRMGQGNSVPDPTRTHCITDADGNPCDNRYAFDFIARINTPIRAARGGVVTGADESQTGNCDPPCAKDCPSLPNAIFIRHQDDTIGVYYHMPENGVFVSKGDVVQRGAVIGEVGNTGCSSTPHLHFQVYPFSTATQSIPIRFRTGTASSENQKCSVNPRKTCVTPSEDAHICASQ